MSVTVLHNGSIFCADAAGSLASALAFDGDTIVACGGAAEVAPYLRGADDVLDLAGRLVVPGFVDAHVHPIMGGVERARCDLTEGSTAHDYRELVGRYAASHPEVPWILGGGWAMSAFPGGCPTREQLDDVVPDRPVFLPNRDHHSAWVNSRALELAGLDAGTPDPVDGRIERAADGTPSGALHEGAADLVERLVPPDSQQDYDAGLREALRYLHSLGVVGWQDAIVEVGRPGASVHEAYLRAQREGWLTATVVGALWWERSCPADGVAQQVADLVMLRDEAAQLGARYRVGAVKVMQDGVAETFTAGLLEPYLDRCGHPTGNSGLSFLEPELLNAVAIAVDAAGFQLHFHALGDRAVREVLDAIEVARAANGTADRRHHVAHLQIVDPADVARFRRLGATANLQALWATHEEQMDELTIPFIGAHRATLQYPFADLLRTGATLAMGSDWPVSSPDPLAAIHVAVNRIAPDAPPGTPPLGAEQALSLGSALRAYTAGSAYLNRQDAVSGTLAIGRRADVVVLDRDPFDDPVEQIAAARVERTYSAGELVHQA